MDVETAFLNGTLREEVFMTQPEGSIKRGEEHLVCKLHKSIYGLKQSPRCWNQVLDEHLTKLNFQKSSSDPCIYTSRNNQTDSPIIIAVYVDDLILAGKDERRIAETKKNLSGRFRMKDLGELNHFLGLEVRQSVEKDRLWVGQTTYTLRILEDFGMLESKPVNTPADSNTNLTKRTDEEDEMDKSLYQAAVGSLLYLSTRTRPDIAFAVGKVAQFSSNPTQRHWTAVKRIMRYIQGTRDLGLMYQRMNDDCIGYADADWGGNLDDRKSTSGYVFVYSNAAVSWRSKKQTCVAVSTAEAEYVSLAAAVQESLWMKQLLEDIGPEEINQITVLEDNQSAIHMATNPRYHGRSKHIDLKYHFIRETVQQGNVLLEYCPTERMVVDIFTKNLPSPRFKDLRDLLGVKKKENTFMEDERISVEECRNTN